MEQQDERTLRATKEAQEAYPLAINDEPNMGQWLRQQGFMNGYLKAEKQSIDKICGWLYDHINSYLNSEYNDFHYTVEYDGTVDKEKLVNDIRKMMGDTL